MKKQFEELPEGATFVLHSYAVLAVKNPDVIPTVYKKVSATTGKNLSGGTDYVAPGALYHGHDVVEVHAPIML